MAKWDSYLIFDEIPASRMVKIQAGEFRMGDEKGKGYIFSPTPEHPVRLDGFYMGQFPVSQEFWKSIMKENSSYYKSPRRPVERVSWKDTQIFLKSLNDKLGLGEDRAYRLPTEAEWEYVARAGGRSMYSGSTVLDRIGWSEDNSQRQTHEVGLKAPNEWGLYGMSGNVREWCQDWFDELLPEMCG